MTGFHAPNIATSKMLQELRDFIGAFGDPGCTSMEIFNRFQVLNPAREVSALRKNGINVQCDYERTNENGKRIYRYRLIRDGQGRLAM